MGKPGPNCKPRICKLCGAEFVPTSSHQSCCNREVQVSCAYCGKLFTKKCTTSDTTKCCSEACTIAYMKQRRAENAQKLVKTCKWCGKKFTASHVRVVYCDGPHYKKCVVCGKDFEFDPRTQLDTQTCSKDCFVKLQLSHRDIVAEREKMQQALLEKYGVDNAAKIPGVQDKIKKTNLEKYGKEWYTQTQEYKDRIYQVSQEKYGVDHFLSSESVKEKRESTCLEKYGSTNVFSSDYGKDKIKGQLITQYGVINPSQFPEFRKKAIKNSRVSSLEKRVCDLLDEYNIEYVHHYFLGDNTRQLFHEFDFYLTRYKILIDCDGLYFHSYLDDPDGRHVLDYYDETRLALVPNDSMFHVIVEGQEDRDMKSLVDILKAMDADVFNYEGYIFNWCRSINFPYPKYTNKRMIADFSSLCKYEHQDYKPTARMGESVCKHFHESIYHSRVGDFVSPFEAWNDDDLLKKAIRNRLIYRNDVDPSKVLAGFNISKICPRVSIFNPVLAKYLVTKYLSEFDTIFDPFSGFSGRLLGTSAAGKRYIGQDLNPHAVEESTRIIEFLNLKNCQIICKDIFESSGEYDSLLTCPPYNQKEFYADEHVFHTCDEWIDICLCRFKCRRYVFVVDNTEKYSGYVKEEIKSTSHFVKLKELLVVIDK